jgi:hypothetical protein
MKTTESLSEDDEDDEGWGMANVPSRESGLPGSIVVFCYPAFGAQGPCIKVSNIRGRMAGGDTFCVSISGQPAVVAGSPREFSSAELDAVYRWVKLNEQPLLDYWEMETTNMSTSDFLNRLEPLPK